MKASSQLVDSSSLKKWIAAGMTLGIVANAMAWFFWPKMNPLIDPLDRLLLAVQCCAGIGIVGFVMLQSLWRLMDSPLAEDPFADAESRAWKINQRVFNNTIEQTLIFAPIFLALAVRMEPGQVHMLPALMTVWCAGRLMFWIGYRHALHARAIGMDVTTVTTTFALLWLLATFW
jgi:uncharacterized membrane protein YecN with MAPEG domain